MKPQYSAVAYTPTRYDRELYSHSCSLRKLEMEENELNEWKAQNPQYSRDHPLLMCLEEGVRLARSDVSMTSQSVLKEWKRIITEQDKRRSQRRWHSIHTLWGLLTPSRGKELGTSSISAPTEQQDEGHSTSSMADDLRSISAIQHWTLERAKHAVTKWRLTHPQSDGTEHELVCLERSLQHARAATGAFNILSIMLRGRNTNSRV